MALEDSQTETGPGQGRTDNWLRFARPALAIGVGLILVGLFSSLLSNGNPNLFANWGIDFGDYWLAGSRVLHGQSPYASAMLSGPFGAMGQDRFRYPPPFALLVVPLSLLPRDTAISAWALISGGALLAGCWLAASAGGARASLERAFWTAAGLALFLPAVFSIWQGNVEGVEVLLLGAALAGVPLVASTAVLALGLLKITPATIAPATIWRFGRPFWRAVLLVGAGLILTMPILLPGWRDFPTVLINELRGSSDYAANLAPTQLVIKLAGGDSVLVPIVRGLTLLTAGGLFLASLRFARQAGGWPAALLCALVASLFAPAVIWFHYLVLLMPFVFYGWPRATRLTRLLLVFELELASAALIMLSGGFLLALPLIATLIWTLRPATRASRVAGARGRQATPGAVSAPPTRSNDRGSANRSGQLYLDRPVDSAWCG